MGIVIYIGKAKNILRRVSSYFSNKNLDKKTSHLVKKIDNVKYVIVNTEMDALLLENNFIKKHQPKYNILLKDDKTYPWICISKEKVPRVFQTRSIKNLSGDFYGPFISGQIIRILLNIFSDFFYDAGWTPVSYLNKEFNNEQTLEKYLKIIKKIKHILKGNLKFLIDELEKKMLTHSGKLEYEMAQRIKDSIVLLKKYQARSTVVSSKIDDVDVISIVSEKKIAFVNFLKVCSGSIIQSYNLKIKKSHSDSEKELLEIALFDLRHALNSSSKTVLSSQKINNDWNEIKIITPKIGEKRKLIELSLKNARFKLLEHKKKKTENNKSLASTKLLSDVKKDFGLKQIPNHIECFDISNTMGNHSVASCVVFKNGKPKKSEYRIFNINSVIGPNDFASMEEVVYRRYLRLKNTEGGLPNLVIVDGGKGQVSSAYKSIKKLGLTDKLPIIGIAKRLEEIYFVNKKEALHINKKSESLKLIQRLRNEAHRFSLKHHKKRRSKFALQSKLEQINGIGPKTLELIYKSFGTLKNLEKIKTSEMEKVIGKEKTKLIRNSFS